MSCYPCTHCNKCGAFSVVAIVRCAHCGETIPPGSSQCPACDESEIEVVYEQPSSPSSSDNSEALG